MGVAPPTHSGCPERAASRLPTRSWQESHSLCPDSGLGCEAVLAGETYAMSLTLWGAPGQPTEPAGGCDFLSPLTRAGHQSHCCLDLEQNGESWVWSPHTHHADRLRRLESGPGTTLV